MPKTTVPQFKSRSTPIQELALIEITNTGKMASNPSQAIAWFYIDGNIIQDGFHGCSYDRQMSRLVKLDVSPKYNQLCDVIYGKLNIDASLYGLKIMNRCFNPVTKLFGVVPVLNDDDVGLMFELAPNMSEKYNFVEIYVERVLVEEFAEKGVEGVDVDVLLALNSSSEQTGLVCGDLGKRGGKDLGKRGGGDLGGTLHSGKRGREKNVKVGQDLGNQGENVEGGEGLGEVGENVEGSADVEADSLNKKMFYMQRVDSQGKRVSRNVNKGGHSGIPLYSSFDGSFMVASFKEPVFTMIRDVDNVSDLEKGMVFVSRDELEIIVSQVHNRSQKEIKVIRADSTHWIAVCKQKASGCKWRLTASKRKRHGFFEITIISGSHNCVNLTSTCVNLTSTAEDANLHRTIRPEDASSHPTVAQKDANLPSTSTPEDASSHPTVVQKNANLICTNMEEIPNTPVVDQSV